MPRYTREHTRGTPEKHGRHCMQAAAVMIHACCHHTTRSLGFGDRTDNEHINEQYIEPKMNLKRTHTNL